ncbi:MAG: YjbQ family protein [Candidatus Saganbacteria bacterium]|nr:YjbQ family protein [Candidatus Saganbacteria bacterium]
MTVYTKSLTLQTNGNDDVLDITHEAAKAIENSKAKNGIVTVFVAGSTGSVTTIEYEPALVKDMQEMDQQLIPSGRGYHHDATWGDANGHSHIRSSIIGPSITVPFESGKMTLGTWQQIVVIDHDNRSRARKIIIQILGE